MVRSKKKDKSKTRKKGAKEAAVEIPRPSQPESEIEIAEVEQKEEGQIINDTSLVDHESHPRRSTGREERRSTHPQRSSGIDVRRISYERPLSRSEVRRPNHSRRRASPRITPSRRYRSPRPPERRRERRRSWGRRDRSPSRGHPRYSESRRNRTRPRRRRSWSRSRSRNSRNPFNPYQARRCEDDGEDNRHVRRAQEHHVSSLPSDNQGIFSRAMSTIEDRTKAGSQGAFGSGEKQETSELAWAIAHKYMLSSTQQFNEKSLRTVLKNKGACTDLKQALKARAAVYGQLLDPAWFGKGVDLSAKTKLTPKSRRVARAMFAGAALFAAQLGFK